MRLVSNTGEAVSTALLLCGGKGDQRHPKRIRFCAEFFLDKRGKDSPLWAIAQTWHHVTRCIKRWICQHGIDPAALHCRSSGGGIRGLR